MRNVDNLEFEDHKNFNFSITPSLLELGYKYVHTYIFKDFLEHTLTSTSSQRTKKLNKSALHCSAVYTCIVHFKQPPNKNISMIGFNISMVMMMFVINLILKLNGDQDYHQKWLVMKSMILMLVLVPMVLVSVLEAKHHSSFFVFRYQFQTDLNFNSIILEFLLLL